MTLVEHTNGATLPAHTEAASLPALACAITPLDMLDRAISQGANIEVLKELMALQREWKKDCAREAFDAALADAKAEMPVIIKNRSVGFDSKKPGASRTDYRHEDLGEIARTVDPILSKHGLSYRWRTTSNPNEPIAVTCIVSHRNGYSEENTLCAGRDDSGNKNSIQAIGSTITYLQRYTLKAALGLAASNDDDGRGNGNGAIVSDEQAAEISRLVTATKSNIDLFLKWVGAPSIPDIPAAKFDAVLKALNAKMRGRS
jgi:hypothetical protein